MNEAPSSLDKVSARDSLPDLDRLFRPGSVAIIGASPDAESITGQPIRHLLDRKYTGRIYPISTKHHEILGLKCYDSILNIPEAVDIAVLAVSARRVPQALRECCEKGIPFAVIVSAGFGEAGEEGRRLQEELRNISRERGIRLVGPNAQGMMNVTDNVCAGFGPVLSVKYSVQPGPVGVITQSGGFGFALISMMAGRGIGFSKIISTGNEADLDIADFLEYMINDDATHVIVAYVEGIADGRRFRRLAELALERGKPLLVWKVGRTEAGKRAANSHTGRLGGDASIYSAVFKQTGCVGVYDVQDLVDYTRGFLHGKRPRGKRVGVFSASGGAGVLNADICSELGLEIPRLSKESVDRLAEMVPALGSLQNPIDVLGGLYNDPTRLASALRYLAADPVIDSIVVINPLREGEKASAVARSIAEVNALTDKPVFVTWSARQDFAAEAFGILATAGVPCFDTPVRSARALAALTGYESRRRSLGHPGKPPQRLLKVPAGVQLTEISGDPTLSEYASKRILSSYGVRVTREGLAHSSAEALSLAKSVKYPVAVKVQSVDIPHKTEAGAVRTNVRTGKALAAAYTEVTANALRHAPAARIDGVLIQEMVSGGVETILGAIVDPSFGPIIMFGLGGIYAEIMDDISFRAAPVTEAEAREMIAETKCHQLLLGVRSGMSADIDALAESIMKMSAMVVDLQDDIAEVDINPLKVMPKGQGVVAVDALIITKSK